MSKASTARPFRAASGFPFTGLVLLLTIAWLAGCVLAACDRERGDQPREEANEPQKQEGSSQIEAPPGKQKANASGTGDSAPGSDKEAPADDKPWAMPDEVKAHDVHTHLGSSAIPAGITLLGRNGIGRIVNLSGGYPGSDKYEVSVELAALTEGRVVPFFNVDWTRFESGEKDFGKAIAADLEKAVQDGFGGVKISKALGLGVVDPDTDELIAVDDERLSPIFEKAGDLGVPVSIHTGDPRAFFKPLTPDNERWEELEEHPSWSFHGPEFPSRETLLAQRDRLLSRHPDTTFICVHFGNNPEDVDYVDRLLEEHPNAYVDISARLGEIGRHDPEKVRRIFEKHRKRILFGTDFMLYGNRSRGYSVTLGSFSKEPQDGDDIDAFYQAHWRFLESDDDAMPNPVPIQGRWDIHPIALPDEVLQDIYLNNADRLIFDLWDSRASTRGNSDASD